MEKPANHNRQPKRITLKKHESIVNVLEQRIKHLEHLRECDRKVIHQLTCENENMVEDLARETKILNYIIKHEPSN